MELQHQMRLIAFTQASRVQVCHTDIQAGERQVTASDCQINAASSALECACQSQMSAACCLARPSCAYRQGQEQLRSGECLTLGVCKSVCKLPVAKRCMGWSGLAVWRHS